MVVVGGNGYVQWQSGRAMAAAPASVVRPAMADGALPKQNVVQLPSIASRRTSGVQ